MSYTHDEDIRGDEGIDVRKLNAHMTAATYRVVSALDNLHELNDQFRIIVGMLLKSFLFTHKSIIIILRAGNDEKYDTAASRWSESKTNMTLSADAMSLVREQIEKVFAVTLLCDDPDKWSTVYIKDDWRRFYEYHLLGKDETVNLPEHKQFHDRTAPALLDQFKLKASITNEEQAYVEFKHYNPNTPLPDDLKAHQVRLFPTPGEAKISVADPAKPVLERWHKEYKYISGYNHGGLLKLHLLTMSDRRFSDIFDESKKEIFYEKEILLPAIYTSFTAFACACTETLKFIPHDVEVLANLTTLWEELRVKSLLGQAVWNLRGKNFSPGLLG
jgi:hypothetical protein